MGKYNSVSPSEESKIVKKVNSYLNQGDTPMVAYKKTAKDVGRNISVVAKYYRKNKVITPKKPIPMEVVNTPVEISIPKRTKRLYTEEEDAIILEEVKNSPENLTKAFAAASIRLGDRTPAQCSYRWYRSISRNEGKEFMAFCTISKKSYGRNRKNCKTPFTPKEKTGFWRSIINKLFK